MRRTSTLPAAIPPTLALLILLLGALAIPSIYAANMRSTLPVIVAPENSTGGLTPNTLYHYNFVFANSTDCTPLLNISVNITTNSRGVGNATLNISSLGVTPAYICEYINGTLRKSHPVFSTMFDNKTAEVDITAYGFDKTSTLNTVFLRNASLPSCAGGQVLTSTGNGVFSCVADTFGSGGNTSWNETRANALYLLINDQRYNDTAIIGTIQNLTYALIAANIGNFSANNNSIWTAINAANNLTLTQITANIGNWSSAATNYYTTAQVNTLGNWSQDKPSYATLAQLNAGANLTYAQIATNIGNWSADKDNYNTTSQLNTLYAPITTIGDNTSWNESRASALYATNSQLTSILNLSLAQITANIGNWSSAATNHYTTAQVNTLGNWSQDKPNYATLAQLNAGANLTAAYVAGAVGQNLTYALITTANGNWSQDKPSYNTTSQLNNLYAPISIVSDNSSWNQSLATTLYAPISTIGDNSSWNQSLASTLYAPITIIGDNMSWNETRANNLYLAINDQRYNESNTIATLQNLTYAQITTNIGNWSNEKASYATLTQLNAGANLTYAQISNNIGNWSLDKSNYATITQVNMSWNESYANTLYAPITIIGDNTSWNETRANAIYLAINDQRYNESNAIATLQNLTYAQIAANMGNWSANNATVWTAIGNLQTANSTLNTSIANINNQITSLANISYTEMAANIGNWSIDKPNYATLAQLNAGANLTYAQIATNIGNWSQDKPNYNTTSQLNNLYAPISTISYNSSWNESYADTKYLMSVPYQSSAAGWTNTSGSGNISLANDNVNISMNSLFVDNTRSRVGIGTALPNAALHVASGDVYIFGSSNRRFLIGDTPTTGQWGGFRWDTTTDTVSFGHSAASASVQNIVVDGSGRVGINTTTPTSTLHVDGTMNITIDGYIGDGRICTNTNGLCAGGGGDNSSWNQSHADTLYAPIGSTGGNNSWNESYASTIYLIANDQRYNESNIIATLQNLTYAQISNNIGNWSADKTSYTTLAQLNGGVGQNLTYALITTANGNWSQDKPNYATLTQLNAGVGDNITRTYVTGAVGQNLTYAQIATNIGNWSAVSANYYTTSYIDTLGNASKLIGTCAPGQIIQNITATGIQCVADSIGSGGNNSWNQSHANTLYLAINDQRYNDTTIIGTLQNLTYAQIATNIGNWSADKPNYATLTQLNAGVGDNITRTYVTGAVGQNLTYALITTANGNWSLDKPNYATLTQLNAGTNLTYAQIATNVGNWSAVSANYYTTSHIDTLGNASKLIGTCAPGQIIQNITATGIQCVADSIGSGGNNSWNQSHADTLYAPIGSTGGNSSWNESRANTIYLTLTDQRYNESNTIATLQNLTYTQIATNIGNFSANNNSIWNAINAANNLTLAQIATNIGNWSNEKTSYATLTQLNAGVGDNITRTYVTGAVGQNLTYALISTNMGNYSANPAGYYNSTTLPYISSASGWTNTSTTITTDGEKNVTVQGSMNVTGALCLGAENGVMPCRTFWGDAENVRRYMSVQIDPFFVCGGETGEYGHWGWFSTAQGTGTDVTCVASPDETSLGTISLGSGTLVGSNITLSTGTTANAGLWLNGSTGITGWFSRTRIANVIDGAQNYTLQIGFGDGVTGAPYTDGIYAVYNNSHGGATYNWTFVTANNNARTYNVTDVEVAANTWYDLECQAFNDTRVDCYINGILKAQITTNIPSGSGRAFEPGKLAIYKNGGVTERRVYFDYYGVYRVFNVPRW